MKLLHLYAGNLYGGIETVLATIARFRHADPDVQHEFGVCFRGRLSDELNAAGATVHELGTVRFSRPWTVTLARRRLASVLQTGGFDAVVTHACWPHAVFAKVVLRFNKVRLVNWVHDALKGDHWINRRAAATPPDLVVANSHYSAEYVKNVFDNVETRVVYCPVEPRASVRSDSLRSELGASESTVALLMASRMEGWKGHQLLIDAVAKLPSSIDWVLWIAGGAQRESEQSYLADLKTQCARLGVVDRVKFLSQRSDIPALMASADVFCQPNSGPEPFGVVFVESLYAGLPVVTSNCGGGAEIVTPECGRLLPPGDAGALANCLTTLSTDNGLRRILSQAGPARAAQLCDPGRQVRTIGDAVRTILSEASV